MYVNRSPGRVTSAASVCSTILDTSCEGTVNSSIVCADRNAGSSPTRAGQPRGTTRSITDGHRPMARSRHCLPRVPQRRIAPMDLGRAVRVCRRGGCGRAGARRSCSGRDCAADHSRSGDRRDRAGRSRADGDRDLAGHPCADTGLGVASLRAHHRLVRRDHRRGRRTSYRITASDADKVLRARLRVTNADGFNSSAALRRPWWRRRPRRRPRRPPPPLPLRPRRRPRRLPRSLRRRRVRPRRPRPPRRRRAPPRRPPCHRRPSSPRPRRPPPP